MIQFLSFIPIFPWAEKFYRLKKIRFISSSTPIQKELKAWHRKRPKAFFRFIVSLKLANPVCGFMFLISEVASVMGWSSWSTLQGKTQTPEVVVFLQTTLSVQATLIGIVIPVIFALVEQLFRQQNSTFKIFLFYSAIVELIACSFIMISFFLILLGSGFLISKLTYTLSLIWAFANICGTGNVVFISLLFFFPSRRLKLIKLYVQQRSLPREIETAVKELSDQNNVRIDDEE